MKVLITGANGFVGKAAWRRLNGQLGVDVVGSVRTLDAVAGNGKWHAVGELTSSTDWTALLDGVESIIHTAARVHVLNDIAGDPLAEFRRVNVDGTIQLARQAAACGVKRFVFVSSIKVNGESTEPGRPFKADDVPSPSNPYGISKLEAESSLIELSGQSGMEVVIVRPPLVYGPGVKANFNEMMKWLVRRVPLPLGALQNQRSLVSLENLVDLLIVCTRHPAAAGEIFLVSDGQDVSTTELLQKLGEGLGSKALLLPVSATWLELAASLFGKRDAVRRLCGSLQVDIGKTRELLQWSPPLSLSDGLNSVAKSFL